MKFFPFFILLLGLGLFSCQEKKEERQNTNTKEMPVRTAPQNEVPKSAPKTTSPVNDPPQPEPATKKKKKTVPQDTLRPINAR